MEWGESFQYSLSLSLSLLLCSYNHTFCSVMLHVIQRGFKSVLHSVNIEMGLHFLLYSVPGRPLQWSPNPAGEIVLPLSLLLPLLPPQTPPTVKIRTQITSAVRWWSILSVIFIGTTVVQLVLVLDFNLLAIMITNSYFCLLHNTLLFGCIMSLTKHNHAEWIPWHADMRS